MAARVTVLAAMASLVWAGASGADRVAATDEREVVTAWGRPVEGLQAGLRAADGRPVASSENVALELLVRNVSKEPRAVMVYTSSMICWHQAEGSAVTIGLHPGAMREFTGEERKLPAGETLVLGRVSLGHGDPGRDSSQCDPIRLPPGRYQVGADDVRHAFVDLGAPNAGNAAEREEPPPSLSTGYLDVELLPPEPVRTAK